MIETPGNRRIDLDALQARFALRVASRLTERADALPHDLSERLRVAREQATARARQLQRAEAVAAGAVQVSPGGASRSGAAARRAGFGWRRCCR